MVSHADLVAAGYVRHEPSLKRDGCVALWQKHVENERGVCYSLNIYEWRLGHLVKELGDGPRFEAEAQFTRKGEDEQVVNVSLLYERERTLAQTEAFFEEIWSKMGFDYAENREWQVEEASAAEPRP